MQKWKTLSSKMALDEKWFKVRRDEVELPNGKIFDDYFVWLSGDVSIIVPVTENGEFILVKQYKHGAGEVVVEFPGGFIEKDETPEQAAGRELAEETGYSTNEFVLLAKTFTSSGKATSRPYIYLAKNAVRDQEIKFDEMENIEIMFKSKDEVLEMIRNGEFCVSDSIAAFFLAMNELEK